MRRPALALLALAAVAACTDPSGLTAPRSGPSGRPVQAASPLILTVTNTDDGGSGSLRSAIAQALPGDEIRFAASLAGQTIVLTTGTLVLDKDLTITGPAAGGITVARAPGSPDFRIFEVPLRVTATLDQLTVRGGAVLSGLFTSGGGILNAGTLTLRNSTLTGNTANRGGAIANVRSYGEPPAALTIVNSTVSGNTAQSGGGGIYNQAGALTVRYSTVTGNGSPASYGEGIYTFATGSVTLESSIVAGNGSDVAGMITSAGANLIGIVDDKSDLSTWQDSDRRGTAAAPLDARLGPLADNGGPTWTHALLARSPALDQIAAGTNGCGTATTTDQRGVARPQTRACDVGAFELGKGKTAPGRKP
jgi:hypothetical protein